MFQTTGALIQIALHMKNKIQFYALDYMDAKKRLISLAKMPTQSPKR